MYGPRCRSVNPAITDSILNPRVSQVRIMKGAEEVLPRPCPFPREISTPEEFPGSGTSYVEFVYSAFIHYCY